MRTKSLKLFGAGWDELSVRDVHSAQPIDMIAFRSKKEQPTGSGLGQAYKLNVAKFCQRQELGAHE
jgi:hypothetical protein